MRCVSLVGLIGFIGVFDVDSVVVGTAYAGSLGDYKRKKHAKRKKVTEETCEEEYIKRCVSKCKTEDAGCVRQCEATAKSFCAERKKKRQKEQIKLVAKGASLTVGSIGVLLDDDMPTVGVNGNGRKVKLTPYTKLWNRASLIADLGLGILEVGAAGTNANIWFRKRNWGLGGQISYLWQDSEYLIEGDFGPTFYMPSASIVAGIQPSVLMSAGNGVDTEYGFGLRAPTNFYIDKTVLVFSPLLGYINEQWYYHLKIGFGYRFHPNVGAFLGYEYRDATDLNDLDITTASHQGAFVYLRLNQN